MHHKQEAPGKISEAFSCPILLILLALCTEKIIKPGGYMLTSASRCGHHSKHSSGSLYGDHHTMGLESVCIHLVVWHWKVETGEVLIFSEIFFVPVSLLNTCSRTLPANLYPYTVNQCSYFIDIIDESW